MFKRLFWMLVGLTMGLGSSFWVQRRLRRAVARYAPDRLVDNVSTAVRGVRDDLRVAVAEGRQAMRASEGALRADVERRR